MLFRFPGFSDHPVLTSRLIIIDRKTHAEQSSENCWYWNQPAWWPLRTVDCDSWSMWNMTLTHNLTSCMTNEVDRSRQTWGRTSGILDNHSWDGGKSIKMFWPVLRGCSQEQTKKKNQSATSYTMFISKMAIKNDPFQLTLLKIQITILFHLYLLSSSANNSAEWEEVSQPCWDSWLQCRGDV